jgi:hypothetical protein
MARLAITIEGGLISSDLVEQIAATPQDVSGQRPADFGLDARLSDEIQKGFSDALAYWSVFQTRLARGRDSATTITRETWVIPLLQDALGYTLVFQRAATIAGGISYAISHRLAGDTAAPPIHIVSFEQELDRKGDAARSPHALIQDYLNRSDSLWGVVTNGRTLRLLRNTVRFSKPSFIEFDLEAIFKSNLYSEFVLFYRLVHATRLPRSAGDAHECWLEKYYQQGIEQGGRVRERLRDGVQEALEILGTGLLSHPESGGLLEKFDSGRLTKIEYYRQLLRLIYRLLFLMVAEERRLLFVRDGEIAERQAIYDRWYSIERLRRRADSRLFDDGHSDLWEGLKQTFRLFEDTAYASQLGLTALDGELFGRFACADLIDTTRETGPKLRNDQLLSAIWHLSTFEDTDGRRRKSGIRRRVNFAGLDVEELGSVYESLLDYHPEAKIDGERSKFELVAGSERKETGSYYTPPELVRELIKSVLEPVIDDRIAKAATLDEKERALLSLKICDPASGSGHFMLAAARRVGRELARVRSGEIEPNPADYRKAVRDVIRRCIYAVDKNPLAVDLCKVALWIEGHSEGLPLSFLDHHVKCGDSLVGVVDFKILENGTPDDAYKAVVGDDKKAAAEVRRRNKTEAEKATLFRYSVEDQIRKTADAFGSIADLTEATPNEVHAKEAAYVALRNSRDWEKTKWACDLWTSAFFSPLLTDEVNSVPTTRHVWDAIGGRLPNGRVAGNAAEAAGRQPFFHWPLEFPEVFAGGGFNIMLGNPPWDVSQSSDANSDSDEDASASESATQTKRNVEAQNKFFRNSNFFVHSAVGKLNYYALFAERFATCIASSGAAGFIVPTGLVTDESSAKLFRFLLEQRELMSFHGFENEEFLFPGIANVVRFGLATVLGSNRQSIRPEFCFYVRRIEQLEESERLFDLSLDEITLFDPITQTCPSFRSKADVELTRRIYERWPILRRSLRTDDNPWQFSYRQGLFNMKQDKRRFVGAAKFAQESSNRDNLVPLYEAKYIWHLDHRFGSYHRVGKAKGRGGRGLPPTLLEEYADPAFEVTPRYFISKAEVETRLSQKKWERSWLIGWRDITSSKLERTSVWAVIPRVGAGHNLPLLFSTLSPSLLACLIGNLNSLVFDYLVRQKIGGTHLTFGILDQLAVLPPTSYSKEAVRFIVARIVELAYTSNNLQKFAADLNYQNLPFKWDRIRRASLRAELDAFYAYLYGLTRRELEYILDPKAVMGVDYPSETFRVLKENEIKEFGEYQTQRLVLEAWDRFVVDGTFDPARLREPQYIDRVAQELTATRAKLEQIENDSKALLTLASATPKPTLFVEGVTDAKIIEAAWSVFFPNEPMPVKVIAAGGSKEMGSLAGKGKALREVLGQQVVLVLADNDSAGRHLTDDGHVRKGGIWRQLQNGVHWCLLTPSASFAAAMKAHSVPADYWPFTIEAAFAPGLRRQAEAAGAWRFSSTPQAELLDNPDLARRLFAVVPKLSPKDDAYWYLMAPHPEAKDAFATWVTDPKRQTEENYAAFEEIVRGLRAVLARRADNSEAPTRARARGAA